MRHPLPPHLALVAGMCWLAGATTVQAHGTSCVVQPTDGPLPAHIQEMRKELHAAAPGPECGYVDRLDRIVRNRKLVAEGRLSEAAAEADGGLRIGGVGRIPVLSILYSGFDLPFGVSGLQNKLFGFFPSGTMSDYFQEVSYGAFDVTGQVFEWETIPFTQTMIESDDNGREFAGVMVTAALINHDDGVDFGQYDNDGPDGIPNSGDDDGFADLVVVMHPEFGGECGGPNVWSHQSLLTNKGLPAYVTNDLSANGGFIQCNRYFVAPALNCDGSMIDIGVWCHEYGHVLGIKDLYDTNDDNGESEGVGWWGLMGSGSWNSPTSPGHMLAWTKERLGWLTYHTPLRDDPNLCLPPVETEPVAARLWTDGAPTTEYFVVENRQRIGFDQMLAGTGLVITHVDEERYAALASENEVNAAEQWKAIDVECADATSAGHVVNADDLDRGDNRGDSNDPWCASTDDTFDGSSVPDSRAYSGSSTLVAVKNVSACSGGVAGLPPDWVCADVEVGNPSPTDLCMVDCDTDTCNEISPCDAWWGSPAIFIDNDEDGIHDIPSSGIENKLHVKVTNDGPDVAVATRVDLYVADPAMGQQWPSTAAQLIGSVAFPVIDSGETLTKYRIFQYPDLLDLVGHWCIGAVVNNVLDPATSTHAPLSNNVAQVNRQVLVARAGSGTGRGVDDDCPGPIDVTSRIYLYDGYNPTGGTKTAKVYIGTPPEFGDAQIPAGWQVQILPHDGPFTLIPGEPDSIFVRVTADEAAHGDMAHIPLTLWDINADEAIGGLTMDIQVDCFAPALLTNLQGEWVDERGDDFSADRILLEWDRTTVDTEGNGELVKYYEVFRSDDQGSPEVLIDRVAVDADPATPMFQYYDHVPETCPILYSYRVRAVDHADNMGAFATFDVGCAILDVPGSAPAIGDVQLGAARPNPARGSAQVTLAIGTPGAVELSVFSADGRRVRTLVDEVRQAGAVRVAWDGRDGAGRELANGVYFFRLVAGGEVQTERVVLAR